MLVFIDESGDPGFKLESGSSPFFVAAMVIFPTADAASATQIAINAGNARKLNKSEFKFSKCSYDVRDAFFDDVRGCDFMVNAISVEKQIVYSPRLKANKDEFYRYFVRSMISNHATKLKDAKVIIDGSGDREFKQKLNEYFKRQIPSGAIKKVSFKDSKTDVLVQLADMCTGAIARSCRANKPDYNRWRLALGKNVQNVWNFR